MRRKLTPDASVQAPPSVSALDAAQFSRHRWYFFKEAFSPAIVDHAIDDAGLKKGDLVVDPFCGSGTSPLQAAMRGLKGHGIEVNPFLAFVARTKLAHCSVKTFDASISNAMSAVERGQRSKLEGFSTFSRTRGAKRWLFNRSVLRGFDAAWTVATADSGSAANFVQLCLLEAAMATCNAEKDGKCLRYRPEWQSLGLNWEDFAKALSVQAAVVREDLLKPPPTGVGRVEQGDVRKKEMPQGFKLCVTSPPYLNSFDYTDVYRPELFLGEFISSMPQLVRLRLRTMRSHVQVSWPKAVEHEYGTRYLDSLKKIIKRKDRLWDRRIPEMIKAYFEDVEVVLKSLKERAAPDASVWLVVSTSAYAGVEIPVDLIIADIATSCGWFLREVKVLRHLGRLAGQQWSELSEQKVSGPHLRESVVVLDARPRKSKRVTAVNGSRATQ